MSCLECQISCSVLSEQHVDTFIWSLLSCKQVQSCLIHFLVGTTSIVHEYYKLLDDLHVSYCNRSQTRSMSAMLTVHGRTKLYRIRWMHERTWWLWSHSNFMNWDLYVVLPLSKVNPQIFQAKWTSEITIKTVTYPSSEGNSVFSAQPSWFAAHKGCVSN